MGNVSVIIPAINEAEIIGRAIESAQNAAASEIIVADGGSADATHQIATQAGCRWVTSPTGRGDQLNAGAAAASGDVLLFLHADACLEPACIRQIQATITRANLWGGFQQTISNSRRIYRWIERGNAARVKLRSLVYGDQGMFIERHLFEQVGGFQPMPLMEDVAISRALKKISRPLLLKGPISVGARRWERNGPLRQTIKNWTLFSLFRLGVDPERLARMYDPIAVSKINAAAKED